MIEMHVGKENPLRVRKTQPGELLTELFRHRRRAGIHEVAVPLGLHQNPGREIPPDALEVHGKIQVIEAFSGGFAKKDAFFGMRLHSGKRSPFFKSFGIPLVRQGFAEAVRGARWDFKIRR
jgi:hypothetical protein